MDIHGTCNWHQCWSNMILVIVEHIEVWSSAHSTRSQMHVFGIPKKHNLLKCSSLDSLQFSHTVLLRVCDQCGERVYLAGQAMPSKAIAFHWHCTLWFSNFCCFSNHLQVLD